MDTVQVIYALHAIFDDKNVLQQFMEHLEDKCKTNPNFTNFLGACKEKFETYGDIK